MPCQCWRLIYSRSPCIMSTPRVHTGSGGARGALRQVIGEWRGAVGAGGGAWGAPKGPLAMHWFHRTLTTAGHTHTPPPPPLCRQIGPDTLSAENFQSKVKPELTGCAEKKTTNKTAWKGIKKKNPRWRQRAEPTPSEGCGQQTDRYIGILCDITKGRVCVSNRKLS